MTDDNLKMIGNVLQEDKKLKELWHDYFKEPGKSAQKSALHKAFDTAFQEKASKLIENYTKLSDSDKARMIAKLSKEFHHAQLHAKVQESRQVKAEVKAEAKKGLGVIHVKKKPPAPPPEKKPDVTAKDNKPKGER